MPVSKKILRWAVPVLAAVLLILPARFFFGIRGISLLSGASFKDTSRFIFPLFGLYAFTLLWIQLMIGNLMPYLRKVYGNGIERYHRIQGLFVLLFATTHPLLLVMAIGINHYFLKDFVAPVNKIYVLAAQTALFLMYLTVGTALLRKTALVKKWWRKIHIANYIIFSLVWLHSWNLGTDLREGPLHSLWLFYGLSFSVAVLWRIVRKFRARMSKSHVAAPAPIPVAGPEANFTKIATIDQVQEGKPFCGTVNGRAIVLFNVGGQVYALDNLCNHAEGPLCEGIIDGKTVECPLHASRFDVTTGSVLNGPATEPQPTFKVRMNGSDVEVAV